MAGLGELLTLGAAGMVIDGRTKTPDIKYQNNKSKKEKTNTKDMYTTNNSRYVRDSYEKSARDRYRASMNFRNSDIIPKKYRELDSFNKRNSRKVAIIEEGFTNIDSDSAYSDVETFDPENSNQNDNESTKSDDGYHGFNDNPGSMLDKMNNMQNNRKFESCVAKQSKDPRNKFNERNTYIHQYDQMTFNNANEPVAENSSNKNTFGKNSNMQRIELERQMEIDGGYSVFDKNDDGTYGVVRPESREFVHENMLPFVRKGSSPFQEEKRSMVNQMTLELFTGSENNPDWRPKVERAPLFSPMIGTKNIYGDPVRTDEYTSRYFPGNERRNELPFQQVMVTPGLDIGYNTVGKQGYHDMYQYIPREAYVNELRTLGNPKVSYGSYMGPGKKGEKGPVVGRVAQYKTPRFRERGTKDMVRGRSYITAPTVYGEYDPKNLATVNRGVKEIYKTGPAQHYLEGNTPGKYRGNYRSSRKENYKYDHPRNVIMYEGLSGQGHNNESFVPDPTQREMKAMHGHAFETNKTYAVNHEGFTPNPTKRNVHDKPDRAGYVTGDKQQIVAVNWDDTTNLTKRNIHDKPDRAGHITGDKQQIVAVNWDDTPSPTKRNIHDKPDRAGHVQGEKQQYIAVNRDDTMAPTKRNLHDRPDRTGHVQGEKQQYIAVNWDDTMAPTKRNLHDKPDRAGHVQGDKQQYIAVNWDDTLSPTKRNLHDRPDRTGHVQGEKQQYIAVNWDDTMAPTKRNLHDRPDRTGHVQGEKQQYIAVNWDDTVSPTKRNIHDKPDRAGHVQGEKQQYIAVNWDDTMSPTKRNLHDRPDRTGHVQGEKQQYIAVNWDDTMAPTKRNLHDRPDRAGHVQGEKQQYIAVNWDDTMAPTKRNLHDHPDRTGHVQGEKQQYIAVNWDDTMAPTKRNLHDRPDRTGHVQGEKQQYIAVNWDDAMAPTKRNLHDRPDRAGHVQGEKQQYIAVNWDDTLSPTKRNLHDRPDRAGHIQGEKQQYIAVNWDDTMAPTKRNLHDRPDRTGHVQGDKQQYIAVNWDDTLNPTKRNLHDRPDRAGHVQGNKQQYIAVNWDDQLDPTERSMNPGGRSGNVGDSSRGYKMVDWTDLPDPTGRAINPGGRSGNVGDSSRGYKTVNWSDTLDPTERTMNPGGRSGNVGDSLRGYNVVDWTDIPDPTERALNPGGRHGSAQSMDLRQGSRHQYMNMNVNGAKEALEDGRAPTKVGMDKGWTIDHTAFRSRCPVSTTWEPGPNSDMMKSNNQLDTVNTNVPTGKFWINDRIQSFTDSNLEGNPLVNNLIHKSI